MNTKYYSVFVFCLLFSHSGCKKEEVISNIPSISFISISPNPAIKYQNEITITLECTDGNGDIGKNTTMSRMYLLPIAETM